MPGWLAFLLGETTRLSEPAEWLRVIGFGLVLPLGLVVFTIRQGSWLVAGEEERNSLGLLLAVPLRRYRLILEKFAVLVLLALVPVFAVWLALSLVRWLGWLPLPGLALAGAAALLFLVGLAFGAPAMALGSLTGRRWLSFTITLAFALLMLWVSRLPGSFQVHPVLRFLSPFYYYNAVLFNRLYWGYALILLLVVVGSLILASIIFERRDLPV